MSGRQSESDTEVVPDTAIVADPPIPDETLDTQPIVTEDEAPPEYVGPEAFSPQIIEPPDDDAVVADDQPLAPGTTRIVYRGLADVAEHGYGGNTYRFRPGEPVDVPSEAVDELLTWPNETFEVVKE